MVKENTHKNKKLKEKIIIIFIDILIISVSFLLFVWIKPATFRIYLPKYFQPFLYFGLVWISVSLFISKYNLENVKRWKGELIGILITNLTILAIILVLMFSYGAFNWSRLIVYGTILLSTILEIAIAYIYFSYKNPVLLPDFKSVNKPKFFPVDKSFKVPNKDDSVYIANRDHIKEIILENTSNEVYNFISKYIDVGNPNNLTLSTSTLFNIQQLPANRFISLVNLHKINDIRRINKFFEALNEKLPDGGLCISSAETYHVRKENILEKYPPVFNRIYYFFDFIFTRVFPKLPVFHRIYYFITLGRNRVLSKAETLGRIYSCGFECIEDKYIDGMLYFVARKIKQPAFDMNPSYGPLFKMKRIGKNKKFIYVYKLRTMHPYSEYIQEYVYNAYGSQNGDKADNDFRVTYWGRFMRKFWIDELPMLINLVKGDLKLVGVRPLSVHKFHTYDKRIQEKRVRFKPGLVPPFYADLPKNFEELQKSEEDYLDKYEKNPFATDLNYFFKAFYNIIFKRARSN